MKTVPLEVRVADLPKVQQFFAATAHLIRTLAEVDGLPPSVLEACDSIRRLVADLGGRDVGAPP